VYDYSPQLPTNGSNLDGYTAGGKVMLSHIDYYLKARNNSGVKLIIYDAPNKIIKDFHGSTLKGLNKVYWPFNINLPKIAKGGFIAGSPVFISGLVAPRVPVYKYKIVL